MSVDDGSRNGGFVDRTRSVRRKEDSDYQGSKPQISAPISIMPKNGIYDTLTNNRVERGARSRLLIARMMTSKDAGGQPFEAI